MRCNHCGARVAPGLAFCAACKRPLVGYSVGGSGSVSAGTVGASGGVQAEAKFAGFWLRFLAALVDAIVLALALGVVASFTALARLQPLAFLKLSPTSDPSAVVNLYGHEALVGMLVFFVIASWLYFAFMESSPAQATLGKKLVGLYVTDSDGQRPSFLRAGGRFSAGRLLAHIPGIGLLYFLVDCVCAGVTPKKQAVHDMITGCLVLRRPPRFEPES